jgi:hypothetical protein
MLTGGNQPSLVTAAVGHLLSGTAWTGCMLLCQLCVVFWGLVLPIPCRVGRVMAFAQGYQILTPSVHSVGGRCYEFVYSLVPRDSVLLGT